MLIRCAVTAQLICVFVFVYAKRKVSSSCGSFNDGYLAKMPTFSVNSISGTVKWVGVLHDDAIAPELYVGVRLDDNGIVYVFCAQFAQIIRLWFDFPVNNFSVILG